MNEPITVSDLFDYNELPFLQKPISCSRLLTKAELFHLGKHLKFQNPALSLGDRINYPHRYGKLKHDDHGLIWVIKTLGELPSGEISPLGVSSDVVRDCIFFIVVTLAVQKKGRLALLKNEYEKVKVEDNGEVWFKNSENGFWYTSSQCSLYSKSNSGMPRKLVLIHSKRGLIPIEKIVCRINNRNARLNELIDITYFLETDGPKESGV
jgi:hypothetical protein